MHKKISIVSKVIVSCMLILLVNMYGINVQTVSAADLPSIELNTEPETEEYTAENNMVEKNDNSESSKVVEYIIIGALICIAITSIGFNVILYRKLNDMAQYQKKIDSIKSNFDDNMDKHIRNEVVEQDKSIEVRKGKYSEVSSTTMLWKVSIQLIDIDKDIVYEVSFNNTDENKKITIGRGERSNVDIKIALPNISDKHCEIIKRGDKYYLKDLASTNGTKYDGARVDDIVMLNSRGMVHLGKSQFELIINDK